MDNDKLETLEQWYDAGSEKIDNGETLNDWEQALYDAAAFLLHDSDAPEWD